MYGDLTILMQSLEKLKCHDVNKREFPLMSHGSVKNIFSEFNGKSSETILTSGIEVEKFGIVYAFLSSLYPISQL